MKEIFKKLLRYHIQMRKALHTHMQGDFRSVFKGSGLEFDDVRSYQYGDDVRSIDWNVSAKGQGVFVKTFKEEKEQLVYFLMDVSGSQKIGKKESQKLDIGKEICAVLSFSALKESSQVGLLCFSEQKELFIKPNKGMKHGYGMVQQLYQLKPKSAKTHLKNILLYAMSAIKRKSVIIIISDFIDQDYETILAALAHKHDVVAIQLTDSMETALPKLGLIPLFDPETNKTHWINSLQYESTIGKRFENERTAFQDFCIKKQINFVQIDTKDDYVPKLIQLFKTRNKGRKRA